MGWDLWDHNTASIRMKVIFRHMHLSYSIIIDIWFVLLRPFEAIQKSSFSIFPSDGQVRTCASSRIDSMFCRQQMGGLPA